MLLLPSPNFFAEQSVKPSATSPNTLLVELHVKRCTVSGTVRFEQKLPGNFNASPSDIKGGIFVLKDSTLSITWSDFPRQDDILISYRLVYPEGSSGQLNLTGMFSYLENNDKRTYDLSSSSVIFGSPAPAPVDNQKSSEPIPTPPKDFGKPEPSNTGISCTREIVNLTEKSVLIKIVVHNPDGITGFARMEDIIPTGYAVKVYDSQGASFSFVNARARIIWTEMPPAASFFCSYKLIKIESEATFIDIEGTFSYLKDGQTINLPVSTGGISFRMGSQEDIEKYKKPPVPVETIAVSNKPAAASQAETSKGSDTKPAVSNATSRNQKNLTSPSNTQKNESAALPSKNVNRQSMAETNKQPTSDAGGPAGKSKSKNMQPAQVSEPLASSNDSAGVATQTKTISAGIVYRVQVCAVRKNASTEQIAKELTLSDVITPEMHDGWFKYTIGQFSEYAAAKLLRNQKSSLPTGPFVTAYNQGNRITVQEALMVTRQSWIK